MLTTVDFVRCCLESCLLMRDVFYLFCRRRAVLVVHPGASAHLLYNAVGGAQGARGAPIFLEHAEPEEGDPEEAAAATAKPLGADALDDEAEGADSRRFFVGVAKAFSAAALWAATQRSICSASQGHDLISQG